MLAEELRPLRSEASPFAGYVPDDVARHVYWVKPVLVGDVEFREFCGSLRHPSWKGLRADVFEIADVLIPA